MQNVVMTAPLDAGSSSKGFAEADVAPAVSAREMIVDLMNILMAGLLGFNLFNRQIFPCEGRFCYPRAIA